MAVCFVALVVRGFGMGGDGTDMACLVFCLLLLAWTKKKNQGLATFIAALANPSLGVTLCVAIALHNIPEGVAVALPVYYATRSRKKAFMWAFLSGVSEPIGALLGWLVLKDAMGPAVYGVMFGMVAGMMVYVCIRELLPTALRYDAQDRFVTACFMGGAFAMAMSLVLFLY